MTGIDTSQHGAIAYTGFYAGLRIAELAALDLDDIHLSAREGMLIVRYGKGGRYREVPVHSQLRAALEAWTAQRVPAAGEVALFVNARGRRLTTSELAHRRMTPPKEAVMQGRPGRPPKTARKNRTEKSQKTR